MSTLSGMSSTTSTSGGSRISAVLWQEFADLGEELARAERLGDVAVAAGFAGLRLIAGQRVGGNGDDRHLGQGGYGADAAGRLVTVDRRQLDIHQNEVGLFALGGGDALQAVHRLDHLVCRLLLEKKKKWRRFISFIELTMIVRDDILTSAGRREKGS